MPSIMLHPTASVTYDSVPRLTEHESISRRVRGSDDGGWSYAVTLAAGVIVLRVQVGVIEYITREPAVPDQ